MPAWVLNTPLLFYFFKVFLDYKILEICYFNKVLEIVISLKNFTSFN